MVIRHHRGHRIYITTLSGTGKNKVYSIEVLSATGKVIHEEHGLRNHKACLSCAANAIEAQTN